MSGHSKWANIRVRKGAQDARRGKIYTKFARLIEIAAREGGGDSGSNIRLRTLIDTAKTESVPNTNIERAIKKGTGELKGDAMQEYVFEGYGPAGVAFIIEALSDNKMRVLSNVKNILSKNGGRFAESGSVLWMFERKGVVTGKRTTAVPAVHDNPKHTGATPVVHSSLEELELELIDFGAEDFSVGGEHIRVISAMTDWSQVRDFLKNNGYEIESAGLQYIPKQTAPADSAAMEKVHDLIEALEEDDDVSEVHVNAA